jgi:hypothetical protein
MSAAAPAMTQVTLPSELNSTRESRRRPAIAGTTTERLPVRACSGDQLVPRPVADPPAFRLTRRGRLLLTTFSVFVFGAAVVVLGFRVAGVLPVEPEFSGTVPVQVGAGQTLWSIAQETNPTEDPRVVVEQIAELNQLRSASDVIPGTTIQVPVR